MTTRALVLGGAMLLVGVTGCWQKGYRFVLPDKYVGWVRVEFDVPGAKSLPMEDGYRLVEVPEEGVVRTSDSLLLGQHREEVYFATHSGRTRAPEFGSSVVKGEGAKDLRLELFMGSHGDYVRGGRRLTADGLHVTGRLP